MSYCCSVSAAKTHLVEVTPVSYQTLKLTEHYTGYLRARQQVRVITQEAGRITHLPYYEGDEVQADSLLLQLEDTLLKAEWDKAHATYQQAALNVQRMQKLAKKQLVSAEDLAQALTKQRIAQAQERILNTRLSYTTVYAPFTGVLSVRLAEPGDVVAMHTHVLTLIDPSSFVIDVTLSETQLAQLKGQEPVQVIIAALGKHAIPATVSRIYPVIDPLTHLGKIEVQLQTIPQGAQTGQFCYVTLTIQSQPQLTVPYTALRHDALGEYVFIVDTTQTAQRQAVRSGLHLVDTIEILEGVQAGQSVITKGFLGLKATMPVTFLNDH